MIRKTNQPDAERSETLEWLESLEWILQAQGDERACELIEELEGYLHRRGVEVPLNTQTPYMNTIAPEEEPPYPGSREIERRIKSIIRWNAMAMVVRANKATDGDGAVGGHISTFASSATIWEVGFNHFFRNRTADYGGDVIFFQGHAAPGAYSRAFLEGRLSEQHLLNFRQELAEGGGLSSYPHPWLMPDFWQYPTVSMGLGPIMSIYHARFIRYMENRGLKEPNGGKVVAFVGDGESDEPETLGALTMASREKLDNLVWCVNCNLQRLDGPVRGNGNIIQELEGAFRGAGWNVIKVIWGSSWDELFRRDKAGLLAKRMAECPDGEYQRYSVSDGAYVRKHFFGKYPELLELVSDMSDDEIERLQRGGHDPVKVYAAFKEAWEHKGQPTVILAKTVKGYGLGEAGEGKNITHQQKKLNEEELREFRTRFGIPIPDEDVAEAPFYRPAEDSAEIKYLHERRKELGGYLPERKVTAEPISMPDDSVWQAALAGSADREASTTMAYVQMLLARLLRDQHVGQLLVPIIPDEARTFGMDPFFRQVGIYASTGQTYDPVDSDQLAFYKEAINGQILEEGITEAGAMSSFIAAGTAYATHGVNTIPLYIYYSMFGFQRVGDSIWAAADARTKGFLLGATAGRTTLNGEGLQHQDGHSHLLASTVPNLMSYDPAFAYEIAVIMREGLKRMYVDQDDMFYYITLHNENYRHPAIPKGKDIEEGILRGLYRFHKSKAKHKPRANLFGSSITVPIAMEAAEILERDYGVTVDVWSATSYTELRRDGLACDRWNMLHPGETKRECWVEKQLAKVDGVFIAASDYMKALPDGIRKWVPGRFTVLGTDGFGRSDRRTALRNHFEIDHRFMVLATLDALAAEGLIKAEVVAKAIADLDIDTDKQDPQRA